MKAFQSILLLAADNRETLRDCDVWRVMEAAQRQGLVVKLTNWLLKAELMPETRAAILEWNA